MPIWINAIGIGCIGVSLGYVMLFALKRYLPMPSTPAASQVPSIKELLLFLISLSAPGVVGLTSTITSVDGINFIGAYGIGLLVGLIANIAVSLHLVKVV